ncbi:uncharacterized protein [Porites lutea]|uniref:uncharacterized protein n=1 Tax=Porites lutea TaxID=51062 RepID=UPI003CC615C9
MGQLAVKFKEWREKLELSHEKTKHASSQNSRPEKRSLTWESRDTPLTRDDGSDSSYGQELFRKLDKLESVMEKQRKFLEDHDIKIQEIENVVNKIMKDKRRQEEDQIETTEIQLKPETLFERLVRPPANEQEDQAATCDLWKMFECHEQILNEHEKRLENNITKIEIIREILEQQKGKQEKSVMKKLKEYEELLKKRCESYEELKKEVEEQLQIHQKLQDNLLAGFLVGFVIMVLICMLPRTLLASG